MKYIVKPIIAVLICQGNMVIIEIVVCQAGIWSALGCACWC